MKPEAMAVAELGTLTLLTYHILLNDIEDS